MLPRESSGYRRSLFTNWSPVGDGGFADHEATVNLALQGGRAVVIEAGHQHGPGLIRKVARGLAQGETKGLSAVNHSESSNASAETSSGSSSRKRF